jgi:hypothetical protein
MTWVALQNVVNINLSNNMLGGEHGSLVQIYFCHWWLGYWLVAGELLKGSNLECSTLLGLMQILHYVYCELCRLLLLTLAALQIAVSIDLSNNMLVGENCGVSTPVPSDGWHHAASHYQH